MIWLIITLFLFIGTGIFCILIAIEKENWVFGLFSAMSFTLVGALLGAISEYNKPTALEVYQGKTILEITYKDSIPTDTVVVYKYE